MWFINYLRISDHVSPSPLNLQLRFNYLNSSCYKDEVEHLGTVKIHLLEQVYRVGLQLRRLTRDCLV